MTWKALLDGLTSLRLTIFCLVAALVLVFAGTLAQVSLGLHVVQTHFFQSYIVWWPVEGKGFRFPIFFGGHLIGGVLLANLLAAHLRRFRWTVRNMGIHLTHFGLIIMLGGALLTDLFSTESQMRLSTGETKNYSEDTIRLELAITDTSDAELDTVTVIPASMLKPGSLLSDPALPFSIAVRKHFVNSKPQMLPAAGPGAKPASTEGLGTRVAVTEIPKATAMDDRNLPSVVIEILPKATGAQSQASLGTWLVCEALRGDQVFRWDNRNWSLMLRPVRYYKPYSVTLTKFTHEKYMGTEIAKNFSSAVYLSDLEKKTSRDVLIYMNHPLRYRGDTFYQSGFDDNDTTSILQVVHNPAVVAPYLGCILVGAGLLFQFSLHLIKFSKSRRHAVA